MVQGALVQTKTKWYFKFQIDIITDFLIFRKQSVVLNRQYSSWSSTEAGVPQGSILGPLMFLTYINDLFDDLTTNVKLFADDTSLFFIVHNVNTSTTNLNNDLKTKSKTGQFSGK